MRLRVLLADDHQIVRQGFRVILERDGLEVVAEAANGRQAVEFARARVPDVAVLDLSMPGMNGLDAAAEMLRFCPQIRILLLTMHTEEYQLVAALRAGIRGYVLKTQAAEELVHAIRAVAAGGSYLSPSLSGVVVDGYLAGGYVPDPLTPRDRQVLQLVAEGKTTKEIASALDIAVKTAETYRCRIMEKLNIHETAGLVRYAIRRGVIQP